MDLNKKRVQLLLFILGLTLLSKTADKCRKLAGEEKVVLSQTGQFSLWDCFDMGVGSIACAVKEGVKLYVYNIRAAHVEKSKNLAMQKALQDAMSQGLSSKEAAKQATKAGKKAAKLATQKAERITGPIISSGWDFFEVVYYGGTMSEGFFRGKGTLLGAYGGGFFGEQVLGKFGYLVGSHLGGYIGGRIGLMAYDVANGIHYVLRIIEGKELDKKLTDSDF
ncbi:hypothetical protein ES332_D11G363900v1 [Gossypium tomentosum]|uniref:Uncharacterized protein n=1 Tax=Gossypium tomentosum TaxID=34277 RepID=A0A5D2IWM3_GOSTO|nr:hypothetical protein ES332_D11G363900v1 [Gossypium tomentosum]